jgi:diaminohydroxyphosphoribosylaminopyrimidine deaminase/5-amino-6-(5-phosphoribosylamino)uracil reductase
MRLALREARKGLGRTSPNPAVGAVVVNDGQVIGRGYHRKAGTPHAEVNALMDAGHDVRGATLYVTLEPCNHSGRTPPCTQAILERGISRVVVGMADPNPQVAGGGSRFLVDRGVSVTAGVLENECRAINRPFVKHVTTGLPWVIMKAGVSLDGRIAPASGQSGWITGEVSQRSVHRLRDRVDAIAVGIGTARTDDPSLTTRLPRGGSDPLRVVLDTALTLSADAAMLKQKSRAQTWIFCSHDASDERVCKLEKAGAVIRRITRDANGHLDLNAVLVELGRHGITSLLVEGGGTVHGAFLRQNLYDEANIYIAPVFLGEKGVPLVAGVLATPQEYLRLEGVQMRRLGSDVLLTGLFPRSR